jgi:restriction system protein
MPRLNYEVEVSHPGLNEYKVVRGASPIEAQMRAHTQMLKWEQKWQRQAEREQKALSKEEGKALAVAQTQEARGRIHEIENILVAGLSVTTPPDWANFYDRSSFDEPPPTAPVLIEHDVPKPRASSFRPEVTLLDRFFPSREERKRAVAEAQYREALDRWEAEQKRVEEANDRKQNLYDSAYKKWSGDLEAFRRQQDDHNHRIDEIRMALDRREAYAVEAYHDLILSHSDFPDSFPHRYELEYRPEPRLLVVSYFLPSLEDLPTVREVKYVATREEIVESHFTESAMKKLYDQTVYCVTLRIVHELFLADTNLMIEAIVFNGFVDTVDRATGQPIQPCIVSLQTSRTAFQEINLSNIDAKACFRKLKGVGSSQLHSLTSITPILMPSREDSRFVDAYHVADRLDGSCNLAAMDWEDFEHLVRELFQQEFSQAGGEVRVTRASRDGGVDAVAFDPNPIRGGKIVIQAKRYTNVVGVAAVRELWGTILNEGATKGVLVTTSQYGPDAFNFAQGKPITLMDGAQLLQLLEKHGHNAHIDLKEAKRQLSASR